MSRRRWLFRSAGRLATGRLLLPQVAASLGALGLGWPILARAQGLPAAERARIERLIRHVAAQRGLSFIRNGQSHDAAGAAQHLRNKLERAGDRVRTVDDFIDGVAAGSWLSGQPYRIRLADGRELLARDWLRGELQRLEGAAAEGRPAAK